MADSVPLQKCPNCERTHNVSVYVTGQKVRCSCGLSFVVRRGDVRTSVPSSARITVRGTEPTALRPALDVPPAPAPRPETPTAAASAVQPGPAMPPPAQPGPPGTKPDKGQGPADAPAAAPAPTPAPTQDAPRPAPQTLGATAVVKRVEVPGYELLELLGKGGMGEVWRAKQLSLGRTVAIKVLAPELAADPEFVQRFEKEAAALAALSHPNIVQIIDRGASPSTRTFFFAMELCEGQSLRELICLNKLKLADRLDLVVQVGHAIAYAHGKGVIHRDLKPENILVVPERTAKVVDFGLAGMRQKDANLALTRAATAMGTLHYMAPEQRRDARSVDERADVYSLGIILYEMLTGDVPVGRFKLPSERVPGLDTRLDKIVSKALEPEPEARYGSAHDMTTELELVLRSATSTPTVVEPAAERPALPAAGEPTGLRAHVAAFLVAFALLAGAALAVVSWRGRAADAKDPAGARTSMPADTNADLGVALTSRGEDFLDLEFGFSPGPAVLRAGAGEWSLEGNALVARVFGPASARPAVAVHDGPALMASDLVLTASFAIDPAPPAGYAPAAPAQAQVLLRGENGARLGVAARLGAQPGYVLVLRGPGADADEEKRTFAGGEGAAPAAGQLLRVRLTAEEGEVSVFVGEEPMRLAFKKKLDYSKVEGRVALSCAEATCRFDKLLVAGRPSQVRAPPVEGPP